MGLEFLVEHLGSFLLALEILILKLCGKSKTAEEKRKALIKKKEAYIKKKAEKIEKTMLDIEKIQNEEK